MKHLGLAAPEQHLHHHVHFTPEQLNRMTDEQLDRAEAAYAVSVALEQEVAADQAQRASVMSAQPVIQSRHGQPPHKKSSQVPISATSRRRRFSDPLLFPDPFFLC